jgi:hypothetical protein
MCILYSYLYYCLFDVYNNLCAMHVNSLVRGVDRVISREQYHPYYSFFMIGLIIPSAGHIQSRCIRFRNLFYLFHRFTNMTE